MKEPTCIQETDSFESDSVPSDSVFNSLWLNITTLLHWVLSFINLDNILARTLLTYVGWENKSLTVARKTASISVVKDAASCENIMKGYITNYQYDCNFLGMDCEWVNKKGCSDSPVALLQLATPQNECFLIQLAQMNSLILPNSLRAVLEDRRILKFGVGILEDAKKLANRYGITVRGCVDLRHVVLRCRGATEKEKSRNGRESKRSQKMGLQALAERIVGVKMDKHWKIRCSDWEADELTTRQIEYAANDALVAVHIFLQLVILKGKEIESRGEGSFPSCSSDGVKLCNSGGKGDEDAQEMGEALSERKKEDVACVPVGLREGTEEGKHDTEDSASPTNDSTRNSKITNTCVNTGSDEDSEDDNFESDAVTVKKVETKIHDKVAAVSDEESTPTVEKARGTVEDEIQFVSSIGSVSAEKNGRDNSLAKVSENVAGCNEVYATFGCETVNVFDTETSPDGVEPSMELERREETTNSKEHKVDERRENNCGTLKDGTCEGAEVSTFTKLQPREGSSLHESASPLYGVKTGARSKISSDMENVEMPRKNSEKESEKTTTDVVPPINFEKAELREMSSDKNESEYTEKTQNECSSPVSYASSSRSFEPVVVTMDLNKLEIVSKQELGYITEVDDLICDPMFCKRAISLCQGIIDQGFKLKSQSKKVKEKKSKETKMDKTGTVKPQKRYIAQVKQSLPHSQCVLLAPDGARLCTLGRKKADWYLDSQLGELVAEEPYTVQLKFEPAGRPKSKEDYYLTFKENVCVVCGNNEAFLSKSIVPRDYRQHFPTCLKDHHSHDILVMCPGCHRAASDHDLMFRMKLAEEYDAPIGNKGSGAVARLVIDQDLRKVQSAAKAILNSGDKLPEKRKHELFGIVQEYYGDREITEDLLQLAATMSIQKLNCDYKSHGEEVVKKVLAQGKLLEFEKAWRQRFLDTMNPRYLPPFWSVDHRHEDLREKLTPK